jgi:hypothetical protein
VRLPDAQIEVAHRVRRGFEVELLVDLGSEKPNACGAFLRADDGPRTRDLRLGKPTLYQLSYVRAGAILAPI